ncbi:Gfo/Idh/MocA family protein [Spongiimicrobium salis]|uniref:Gfo/Idh/MocA family protein n=1 Tax=Spongiimicrobium salis TaxID=1667022 RepID=UPI00374D5E80
MGNKIRWGILGPGKIAHHFVKDLQLVEEAELCAVASRTLEKAEQFKSDYNVKHAFGSYQELFACEEVDVIYIATPHTHHAKWAIEAMRNGKHVLCEKPLGINTAEVHRIIQAAKANKVFLMEALWSRFNPTIQKIKERIDKGDIGTVGYVNADFAFYAMDRDVHGRVLNPELAGGTLLDIGIYPIFLAYLILGVPSQILATSNFHENGAEVQTSMIFSYDNAQAVLYSGFTSKSRMKAEIAGSEGSIYLDARWHETQGYTIEKNEVMTEVNSPTSGRGYSYEIEEVHRCLKANVLESELWSHQNSMDLIGLLDQVRSQAGIRFPFEA